MLFESNDLFLSFTASDHSLGRGYPLIVFFVLCSLNIGGAGMFNGCHETVVGR